MISSIASSEPTTHAAGQYHRRASAATAKPCLLCVAFALACCMAAQAQEKRPAYYEDDVAASNPLRAEQAKELDAYIIAQKRDKGRLQTVFQPDYSSPKAFEKS